MEQRHHVQLSLYKDFVEKLADLFPANVSQGWTWDLKNCLELSLSQLFTRIQLKKGEADAVDRVAGQLWCEEAHSVNLVFKVRQLLEQFESEFEKFVSGGK
jgi:hypothetical protein